MSVAYGVKLCEEAGIWVSHGGILLHLSLSLLKVVYEQTTSRAGNFRRPFLTRRDPCDMRVCLGHTCGDTTLQTMHLARHGLKTFKTRTFVVAPRSLSTTRPDIPKRPEPAYPGHIPLNWFENAFLAVGSGLMSLANPHRGGEYPF